MINGVGNLISFSDSNISSNNQYELENYNDSSFAEMLNKLQNENIYSESSTNKSVDREDYNDYSRDDFKKYLENMENDKVAESNNEYDNKIDNSKINNDKENNIDEKNIESQKSEKSLENENVENVENNIEKKEENNSDKLDKNSTVDNKKLETIKSIKEKAKNILENNNLFIKNAKSDNKSENLSTKILNLSEEEKENIIKEIDNLKKEIKNLELNDNEEEDLNILFESLENIKNIIFENSKEKNSDNIKESKELQIKDLQEKSLKELKENLKETELNKNTENIEEINSDYNFDFEDNIQSNKRENKTENLNNNFSNNLNKTISDDNGAEITIINMKDSPEGANLKGFNHYNNVSKAQNSNSLTENMIKFQDLMGKLVEKAQVALNNGKSEVLMSLNPEYLGKVRLKISMEGDNFVGKIFVDNAEIKDIFTKNLDTVITSLNEIGINIEGFDVMLRQDMTNGEFSEFSEFASNNAFGNNDGDFAEEVVADIQNYIIPERKLNLLI